MIIEFPIRNCWSGEVQFTAKIEADDTTPTGVKIGLAVQWAIKERADLTSANLTSANLTSADLRSADLTSADLTSANLRYANLTSADLRSFQADMWMTLTQSEPNEVRFLIAALRAGAVNGSAYGDGKSCACLVGTLARFKGEDGEHRDHSSDRPAERWFMMISVGDKPTNETGGGFAAKMALQWTLEWCAASGVKPEFPKAVKVPEL